MQSVDPEPDQQVLERIVEEYTRRIRNGDRPSIAEFQDRYPQLKEQIQDLLSSVAMIEELKQANDSVNQPLQNKQIDEIRQLRRIGDYRIERELGRGGMGIVFLAVHESLGRKVALKIFPGKDFDDGKQLARFKREAQAAANLHHTNIVGVFGVGESSNLHYYVMEYIDGQSLAQVIRALRGEASQHAWNLAGTRTRRMEKTKSFRPNAVTKATDSSNPPAEPARMDQNADDVFELNEPSWNSGTSELMKGTSDVGLRRLKEIFAEGLGDQERFRWVAKIGAQIADALGYAHRQGILHRDMKPSNLLLDQLGTVWITDFGLVKSLVSQTLTGTGDIIGTPEYMAPEAFEGQYDQRSETYCLALTLYELATLEPAFEPSSTPELLRRIMTTAPRSPSKITPQIPRDLNTIIEKALSKSPAERYQSAVAIRDDLLAFLAGRAISARPFSTLENAWRWSKRNPLIASLVTISSGLVLTVAILATWGYFMSMAARDKALEDAKMLKIEQEKTAQALALANRTKEQLQHQFVRAEANVAMTVEMFDQMFRKIIFKGTGQHDQDLQLDGFRQLSGIETAVTEADATFLLEMLVFYQKFAEQNLESRQLREQTGRAFRRIANIYHLTGDYDGAQTAYESALQIFTTLLTEQPESVAIAVELVVTRNELANAMELQGDFVGSQFDRVVAHYDQTLEILNSHPRHDASEIQLELARTLNLIAAFVPRRPIDIPTAFRQSNQNVNPTTESAGESGESRFNRVQKNKANWIGRAVAISDRLVEQDTSNVEFKLVRARSYCQLA
jgi:serine/threonine protein kinase